MSLKQKKLDFRKEKQKMKRSRFNYVPRPIKNTVPIVDPKCQEATPELLRIEIDQIFKDFLDDPESNEYIFPSDLNNLQRKYIHSKAQAMNIISKSHGKEPNRRLHIKKKTMQMSNQSFVLTPCQAALSHLYEFGATFTIPLSAEPSYRQLKRGDKVIGKLVNGIPTLPTEIYLTKEIVTIRNSLPIYDHKDSVIETIRNNQVVIIASETGSGKTTQVPQYIMEDRWETKMPCKIICTQPRRISTVAAAERVAFERGDTLGASVGYHIRLEQKYGISTNLIYCTTGVFLRNLMVGKDALHNITHIIIDEVHERDKLSDFLLICLRQRLKQYPKLKIILMSATVNTTKFLEYFGVGQVLSIPGRLYPIDIIFLEDILLLTKYMSPKMRDAMVKEQDTKENVAEEVVAAVLREDNPDVDDALDEYLNFSDNYDYRIHYEEATAQLGMYFLSEGISVDYQHSKNGRTALMIAAYLGDKEFISRLCNMGANINLYCKLGKTAFDYANNPDTYRLLEYIKSKQVKGTSNNNENKEAEHLLHLFDKTTSDDCIDYDLIVRLITFIHHSNQEGSILVFLPGYDDIMVCNEKIIASSLVVGTYKTFFLHGSMNIRDQHEVFKHVPGRRKIILSTNIAETSITIEDVVFVIDSGKAKEKCYDSYNKVSSLQTHWISQACAKQRCGRAGRTRPGMCFRLFSRQRFLNMEEERVPEILRVSLEELCLHTKIIAPHGMNIHNFLMMAPDAPSANSIKVAIENLQFLGALDKEEDLTRLGEYLAQLTIEPHLGKMLIYSVIFRCLEPILTLTAAMTHKDPFQLPPQANLKNRAAERRRELLDGVMSDHLLYLMVFKKWQDEAHNGRISEFCSNYFISHPTMNSILETRSQLLGQLRAAGFINQSNSIEEYNRHANCWPLVKAIICTGVYPNLAYPLHNNLATRSEKKVNIQNNSACANKHITTWLLYDEKIKHRNSLLIRGVTAITTITVSLMCGIDAINPTPNSVSIDEWVEFEFPDKSPLYLRAAIEYLVKKVLYSPSHSYNELDYAIVQTLHKVLEVEEVYADLRPPVRVGEKPRFFFPQNDTTNRRVKVNKPNLVRGSFVEAINTVRQYKPKSPRKYHNGYRSQRQNHYASSSSQNSNEFQGVCNSLQNLKVGSGNPAERLLCGLSTMQEEGAAALPTVANGPEAESPRFPSSLNAEEKFGDYSDAKIFILIKPRQKRNVEIAQQTSKWIFAPQTEKKILHFTNKGKTIFLLFTVNQSHSFQGMARYVSLYYETSGKPTANVEWMYKLELEFAKIRQLRNPYNENRPIYEGLDGQVIEQTVAEELVRIYTEVQDAYENAFAFPETSRQGPSNSRGTSS